VRRTPAPDNPEIRKRMREIAAERRRFGYRRIGVLLAREGFTMNHKKLRRLYREEGLAVKRRRGRKRSTGSREPIAVLPAGSIAGASTSYRTCSDLAGASVFWR